jgi:hypothetical protein
MIPPNSAGFGCRLFGTGTCWDASDSTACQDEEGGTLFTDPGEDTCPDIPWGSLGCCASLQDSSRVMN